MAADKKPMIVVKKITVVAASAHGGSWKVAFADFMTAMMAFFLVMWLVNSSEDVKKSVSDYFSTPSIVEYNFSNYGVELTLEKLFLDLINEPLKAFEQFVTPTDKVPSIMDMGTAKIGQAFLMEKIGELAKNVNINSDEISFDIPDTYLFEKNTAKPTSEFLGIMDKVAGVTDGLKDVEIYMSSEMAYPKGVNAQMVHNIADERLDLAMAKVEKGMSDQNTDIYGKVRVEMYDGYGPSKDRRGYIRFRIAKKTSDGKARKSKSRASVDSQDDFQMAIDKVSGSKKNSANEKSKNSIRK